MRKVTRILALLMTGVLAGCQDTIEHQRPADGQADSRPAADGGPASAEAGSGDLRHEGGGGLLSIFIRGDLTPKLFSDGLSGQTPKQYVMGLGRFDILRSAGDPSPVTVFDHGQKPVEVNLLSETLGGSRPLAELPAGTYSHGRVLLTHARFTVAAVVHAPGVPLPGDIASVVALSDGIIDGKPWTQGQATFSFAGFTVPGSVPALPSTAGGTIVSSGGRTWLVFPFPKPLTVGGSGADHRATIIYQVHESFRWQDQDKAGYQPKIFDVDPLAPSFEPVLNFGATGYAIEVR